MNIHSVLPTAHAVITNMTTLGVALSAELIEAVAVYDAADRHVRQQPAGYAEATRTATADTIADLIEEAAFEAAKVDARREVAARVLNELVKRVAGVLNRNGDSIVTTIKPVFDKDAEAFVKLAAKLPAGWADPSRLVAAGADAVDIFTKASQLAARLDTARAIRMALPTTEGAAVNGGDAYTIVADNLQANTAARIGGNGLAFWVGCVQTDGFTGLAYRTAVEQAAYVGQLDQMAMVTEPVGDGLHDRLVKRPVGHGGRTRNQKPVVRV